MIKKTITIICFFITIIVAGYFESKFVINSFDGLVQELCTIKEELAINKEQIDSESNIQTLKNIHKNWQKSTKILKFFVWHTGFKDVEIGLSRITSYTEENDYTEAYTELNNLIDYCIHYCEDYKFNLQNII